MGGSDELGEKGETCVNSNLELEVESSTQLGNSAPVGGSLIHSHSGVGVVKIKCRWSSYVSLQQHMKITPITFEIILFCG